MFINTISMITFPQAKVLATENAKSDLSSFMPDNSFSILDDSYLEAGYCWIFFKNPHIIVPDNALLGINWAYAVSKRGNCRMVYDLRYDAEKMRNHLESLSTYFKDRGE